VFLQTTGGEIPVAGVGRAKKEGPRAIAMTPRKIRWRVHPKESANVQVATPRI